jgi:hypothetical protein
MINAMERVTTTMDKKTLAQVRRRAGRRGVSAFIEQAVREKLQREAVLAMLDALDESYGAPSPKVIAEVDAAARRFLKKVATR